MKHNALLALICMVTLAPVRKMRAMDCDSPKEQFFSAIIEGDCNTVAVMLAKKSVSCDCRDESGDTPLIQAVNEDEIVIVRLLLDAKADVNHANNDGETALHKASLAGHCEIARLLLSAKANVNHANNNEDTPLHETSWIGHKEMTDLLLMAKAYVNHADNDGDTALHKAVWRKSNNVVNLLLTAKADPFQKNYDKKNALQLDSNNPGITNIILNKALTDMLCTIAPYTFCEEGIRNIIIAYWNYDLPIEHNQSKEVKNAPTITNRICLIS